MMSMLDWVEWGWVSVTERLLQSSYQAIINVCTMSAFHSSSTLINTHQKHSQMHDDNDNMYRI